MAHWQSDLVRLFVFLVLFTPIVFAQTAEECAYVNDDLYDDSSYIGRVDTCLCSSQLPSYIASSTIGQLSVDEQGYSMTVSALLDLIRSSSTYIACSVPEGATLLCSASSSPLDDPCASSCPSGYSVTSTSCTCEAPNVLCNGQCGNFPSCNSKRATFDGLETLLKSETQLMKRHFEGDKSKLSTEEKKQWKADQGIRLGTKLGCLVGQEACGVYGGSRTAWECIDTMNDLESCGGCTIPLIAPYSAPSLDDLLVFGTDCTALPGVADVACIRGECAVQRCERGWSVSPNGRSCYKTRRASL